MEKRRPRYKMLPPCCAEFNGRIPFFSCHRKHQWHSWSTARTHGPADPPAHPPTTTPRNPHHPPNPTQPNELNTHRCRSNRVNHRVKAESSKRIHLVMEYADGGNLCSYVKKRKRLDEGEARRILQQLLEGVSDGRGKKRRKGTNQYYVTTYIPRSPRL